MNKEVTNQNFPTPKKKGTLKTLLLIWPVVALLFSYLFYVAVKSDYNESGIFILVLLIAVFALSATWKTKFIKIKTAISIVLVLLILALGIFFIAVGQYQQKVRRIIARHTLFAVGQGLEMYFNGQNNLPDCIWTCMTKDLEAMGYWKKLEIPYEDTKETALFDKVPMKDGWGCRYFYENLGQGQFVLKSSGADRRFFTEDDLIYRSGQTDFSPLPKLPVMFK